MVSFTELCNLHSASNQKKANRKTKVLLVVLETKIYRTLIKGISTEQSGFLLLMNLLHKNSVRFLIGLADELLLWSGRGRRFGFARASSKSSPLFGAAAAVLFGLDLAGAEALVATIR